MDLIPTQTVSERLNWYAEQSMLRSSIQLIPYVGGALDTLLGEHGRKIREGRINHFIASATERIERLELCADVGTSEELYDLISKSIESAVKTRSADKRKRFAEIFAKQISKSEGWEEAETAIRFLDDLSDLHIFIMKIALSAPVCSDPFDGLKVITLSSDPYGKDSAQPPLKLTESLIEFTKIAISMGCSELVAKGLLHDESVGRYDAKALDYLTSTDLASWLMDWIEIDS